jgi:hypothetical protein
VTAATQNLQSIAMSLAVSVERACVSGAIARDFVGLPHLQSNQPWRVFLVDWYTQYKQSQYDEPGHKGKQRTNREHLDVTHLWTSTQQDLRIGA